MSQKKFNYEPVYPGFDWSVTLVLRSDPPLFPAGIRMRAQLRADADAPVMATISTADATLNRVDNDRVEIVLPGAMTRKWAPGTVMLDIVRMDTPQPKHMAIRIQVAVKASLTAPR